MKDDRVTFGDLIEDVGGTATGVKVVFREDLEPIDFGSVAEDVGKVDGAEADAETEVGEVPSIRHEDACFR
jgi:hypothetical protein